MKSVQGFVSISQYISNVPGEVSPIGELSTYSRTFTKEIGQYRSDAALGYTLSTFKSSNLSSGEELELDQQTVDLILNIIRETVSYASSNQIPYDVLDFRTSIAAVYPFVVTDIDFGPLTFGHNIELPEFISFTSSQGEGAEIKIWLADLAFRDQYNHFSITVIPPLGNLNSFNQTYDAVGEMLDKETIVKLMDRVQVARDFNPDSVIRVREFKLVNQFNRNISRNTSWGYLVYGKEGDNDDALKDATVEFLLENSDMDADYWETIFPEIFQRTEFLIVPRWDVKATENLTDDSSLYSQVISTEQIRSFPRGVLSFLPVAHIDTFTYSLPLVFRNVFATVTNGLRNAEGKTDFKRLFPDYLPFPSSSTDFGRMQLYTGEWSIFIQELVRLAESSSPTTILPSNYRRVYRDGKLFISGSYDQINFLVASKWNQAYR